jgi:hypothetical protein
MSRRRSQLLAALLALAALAALVAPSAGAAIGDEEELWRAGGVGTGAGELQELFGLASDPVTGHLYAADQGNNRISEFTPWGDFVRAFGWDVAPGAVNEQQEVRVRAATGWFKLRFGADTTADLPFNATAAEVEAALNGLASILGGGGSAGVKAVLGTPDGKTPSIYVVAFKGSLAGTDVAQLVAEEGTTPLSGGVPSSDLLVRTRAEGSAGGTGLESCTAESGCQKGTKGPGAGQLNEGRGLAVDSAGNVYVREVAGHRVQKFDSAGHFLLMFGGEVNKTTTANRCTEAELEGGDVCGIGVAGNGNGQFGESFSAGITMGAGGKLYVADVERIQRFDPAGAWEASVPVPGKTVQDLAIAPSSGDFYALVGDPGGPNENVRILDATTGAEKGKLQAKELENSEGKAVPSTKATAGPLAVDPAGNVFARRNNLALGGPPASPLLQFDPTGKQVAEFGRALPAGAIEGFDTNAVGDLHVSVRTAGLIIAFGPGPVSFEAPPKVAPTITAQFAASVQRDSATLGAEINPHFFSDTRYYLQYGTGKCSAGGCPLEIPAPPGALLTSKTSNVPVRAAGLYLEGLNPGTVYHYRFIAQSGGGGPVYGIDPDGPEGPAQASSQEGLEATFTTPDAIAPKACPNDVFRSGFAARLPDCRAYEMVSPIDKNNGDIKTLVNLNAFPTSLVQSSADGSRLTYSSARAFADPKAAPFTAQLLATRGKDSWASEGIDPPQGPAANTNLNYLGNNFKLFSPDLCTGWLVVAAEPQLDPPRDTAGYPNVYRRRNCGADKESYSALVGVKPTINQGGFYPELQGASADGSAAIFRIDDLLTDDAPILCISSAATGTVSYQWLRNGTPIAGATSFSYVPGDADSGAAIQCQVTANNGLPGSTQVANPPVAGLLNSAAPPPVAPAGISAPTPSEKPLNVGGAGGQTLSCDPSESSWQGSPTFSYRWYRNGTEIAGATASAYVLTASDLATAATFQCAVTGTNAGGSVVEVSATQNTTPAPADPGAGARMFIAWRAYYASKGELHSLCVLPSGLPSGGNCSAGTGEQSGLGIFESEQNRVANVTNAISADDSRVYWTDSGVKDTGAGKVYLRINPAEEQSALAGGECTEEEKACTVKVSETKTSKASRFLGASPDGSKALFEVTEGTAQGDLYRFDAESGESTLIARKTLGVAGMSEDLSRVYFVSEKALDGAAVAGKPNLYLGQEDEEEGEADTFIATLSKIDAVIPSIGEGAEQIPSVTARKPIYHAAGVSPDGGAVTFISTASLSGYDNTDLNNGRADSEVYLYEAGSAGPVCISCNPSGARPQGRVVSLRGNVSGFLPIAATLTLPTTMLHAARYLSADGNRVFFNSFDPLLPRDTNNATDVYMWERAASKAECASLGAELYVPSATGCISLISSGESPQDSEFLDASVNGDDAFFLTNAGLLPQDPGLFDIYDARVGGGQPPPGTPLPDCQGETCKAPITAPNDQTPASSTFRGKGNVASGPTRRRCAKGKARRQGRCVAKRGRAKKSTHHRGANSNRGANR